MHSSRTIDASELSKSNRGDEKLQVDRHFNVIRTNILEDGKSDAESIDLNGL